MIVFDKAINIILLNLYLWQFAFKYFMWWTGRYLQNTCAMWSAVVIPRKPERTAFPVVVVQSLSPVRLHNPMNCRTPGLPCPSVSPTVCSNSCPLSQWCHPTISSSVVPFSSCLQSFPASGSFPMSQLFALGAQSIGASASVLSLKSQGWFPLGLTGLISLLSKGLSRVFSSTTVWKHQFFSA